MKNSLSFFSKLPPGKALFWVIFTPNLVLSLIVLSVLFSSRIADYQQQLDSKALRISDLLVTASQLPNVLNSPSQLAKILQNALNYGDINNIQIFNSRHRVIAESGAPPFDTKPKLTEQVINKTQNQFIIRITPIYNTSSPLDRSLGGQPDLIDLRTPNNLAGWVKVEVSESKLEIQKYQLFSLFTIFFLIFNGAVAYVAWRASLSLSELMQTLLEAVNKLVKGQFIPAKSLKLPPPFSPLQKDIRELAERLESHKEELNAGIEQSTEDMRRNMDSIEEKSAQLHIANKEAMESNRLKSQFLANISHEVRTPLNAILGYTKILQKSVTDDQHKQYISTIEQSTNSLLAIIGDILDFSKIEAGKLSLDNSDVNLRELVDDVHQILSANLLSSEKQIDLVPEFSQDVPQWVTGDSIRIRQILNNLIGNAIKFTHKGSVRTKVSVTKQTDKQLLLSFKIIDTGIGIPEDKLSRLFKPFSQVDTSTTRKFGGTGLGLVITKKLVEQMDGNIDVYSDPSHGSTFYFTLSLKPSEKEVQASEELNKHVLLLEPSNLYRQYLNQYLQDIGIECTACSSLEQMIAKLSHEKQTIDALLINVSSSEDSTNEARELITYASQQFNVPSILMVQPPGQVAHYPTLKTLCSDVLIKPISHQHLYTSLKNLVPPNQEVTQHKLHQETNAPQSKTKVVPQLHTLNQQKLTILAVDDTPINLQLLTHWLTPNGVDVFLAYSGQQALSMAQEQTFDLILMDIQMPEMDGIEATKQLRAMEQYKNTPIIAVTAHALGAEQEKIRLSGINAYLTKPIDENVLLKTIETWCSQKEPLQQQIDNEVANAFDLGKALEIVNQKSDLAKEMFDMLADTLEDEKRLIKHHFEQKDTDKLIHVVHRIHGASKYTGTVNVTKHAGYLENHLKDLGLEDVDGVLEDFIDAIDELLNARPLIKWPQE